MRQIISNPDLRITLSKAGRAIAQSMQWSDTAAGYLRVYEEVLETKQKADRGYGKVPLPV